MTISRRQQLIVATCSPALPALAQNTAPLRLVVPYAPGGPLDRIARVLAEEVKDSLGTVIVENKPGAGGNLGVDQVARSAPDGRTLVMGAVATHALWNPPINRTTTLPAPSLFLYHSAYGTHWLFIKCR